VAVDHIGQSPFEGPHGLHRRFALGQAAAVVRPAGRVVTELDDGHDVQDPVDTPVAGPGQMTSIVADRLCGSMPITTRRMGYTLLADPQWTLARRATLL
jgi:hypothetical protein